MLRTLSCLTLKFAPVNDSTTAALKMDILTHCRKLLCLLAFLTVASVTAGDQKLIRISTEKVDGVTSFFVENLQYADVTVTIEMETENLASTAALPFTATIPPRARTNVFVLTPENPREDSTWSYTYYATWGSLHVTHDNDYIYALPYPSGMKFPVSQAFHGKYSHPRAGRGGGANAAHPQAPHQARAGDCRVQGTAG